MNERETLGNVNRNILNNPEQGRLYLKAALEQDNEQVFLQALHNIIDSFVDSDLDLGLEEPTLTAMGT